VEAQLESIPLVNYIEVKKMKMIKLELNTIVLNDLDGQPVNYGENVINKAFGNAIFTNNPTIEIEELSRRMHRGEDIDVTEDELFILIHINFKLAGYSRFLKNGINEYLLNKLENYKSENYDNKN